MRTGSVFFLLGVGCLTRLPELPSLALLALLPIVAALAWRWRWMVWGAWFLSGFLWALVRAEVTGLHGLDPALEGRVLEATGEIDSLPSARSGIVRFDFDVAELRDTSGRAVPSPGTVRLSWYYHAPEVIPGDRWKLTVKLKRPVGFMNPGGFDYEGWLFQQGIRATGYVVDRGPHGALGRANPWNIDRYRYAVREKLYAVLGPAPLGSLVTALAVGDQTAMTADQWRVLNRSGTTHLLAISGLHIGLFAGMCFLMVRRLWPVSAAACRLAAAPRAAAFGAVLGAVGYAAMAGFSVPTQRSVVMIIAWIIAASAYWRTGTSQVLAFALLAVLLFDPFSVLAPGFWLSFLAVAAIAWGMSHRVGQTGWWWRWGRVQVVVALGLVPVLVLWFQQVPLLGIAANLIAVPWVSLLSVPLILAGCAVLPLHGYTGELLLRLTLWTLDLLWPFLEAITGLDFNLVTLPAPTLPVLLLAAGGVVVLLLPKGIPGRWLGVFWMAPLFLPARPGPLDGEFHMALLDVGQGLSAVVQTREHVLVYDTGPRFSGEFSAGSAVILPYLRHLGIGRVNLLVQSHGDNDHIGGLPDVLDGIEVERIIAGVPEALPQRPVQPCHAGMVWRWDGVDFGVLHPPGDPSFAGNNRSCVIRISRGTHTVLLTGDIEREAEQALLHNAAALRATVLIAPHHGSRTSSSTAFIDAVQPDLVLFPAGYRNRFGFPKQDIIARYQQHGARILDTGRSGAIEVRINDAGFSVRAYRRGSRRFWHTPL